MKIPVVGLSAWLVPGLGHILAGERNRGIIILVTIGVTFWSGVAIGSVRHAVDPQRKKLWFMAQICAGTHAIAALGWGEHARRGLNDDDLAVSRWSSIEVAMVYTGVAGLLNLLAVIDALVRADPSHRRAGGESGHAAGRGVT
ncbi:MAG: DUF6677 family protein [Phycisphaerae bacterium]